jgi:hypothetical protein
MSAYKGISKSFQTESIMEKKKKEKKKNQQQTLEKQHVGLWWQNSLD